MTDAAAIAAGLSEEGRKILLSFALYEDADGRPRGSCMAWLVDLGLVTPQEQRVGVGDETVCTVGLVLTPLGRAVAALLEPTP